MADINAFLKSLGIAPQTAMASPLMDPSDSRSDMSDDDYGPSDEDMLPALEEGETDSFVDVQPMKKGTPLASKADIAKIQAIPLPETQKSIRVPAETLPKSAPVAQAAPQVAPPAEDTLPDMTQYIDAESSKADKIQSLLEQYQAQRNASQGNLNTLRGVNKVMQAMATGYGGKIDDGSEMVDALEKQLDQPTKDYAARIADEENQPNSDISKFMRQQAYAILKKISPDTDYAGKLENMSANQLKKLPGMKNAFDSKGGIAKAVGFGQFVDGKTNQPLFLDQTDNKVRNAITGEVVTADTPIVRPIAIQDAFGNRQYVNPQGNIQVLSSKRENITPDQMDKKSEVEGFKPDDRQRSALDKEKDRVDSLTKNVNEKLGAASRILGALDGDSKQAMAVIKTQMPRLAGEVGNLNQSEQEVWQGSQGLLDKAFQFLSTKADSELTEDNKQELRKILGIFLKEAETSRVAIMDNSIQSLAEIHNIPPNFSRKVYPAIKSLNTRQKEVVDGDVKTPEKSTSKGKKNVSDQMRQDALKWIEKNPGDPRIADILKKLGM